LNFPRRFRHSAAAIFAFAATRTTRSFRFGVSPLDPWTIAATLLGFAPPASFASWMPAAHATRIRALLALSEE